jgi:hypothetical protein
MVSLGDFPGGGTRALRARLRQWERDRRRRAPLGPREAFRWTSGGAGGSATRRRYDDSIALGVSGDGNTVVGESSRERHRGIWWTIGSGT